MKTYHTQENLLPQTVVKISVNLCYFNIVWLQLGITGTSLHKKNLAKFFQATFAKVDAQSFLLKLLSPTFSLYAVRSSDHTIQNVPNF